MNKIKYLSVLTGLILIIFLLLALIPPRLGELFISSRADDIERGAYLVQAAGCISCHISQDQPPALSGGQALDSPFGTFFVPNITPDPETGIGTWTQLDLVRAIKHGRSPSGRIYFPAFPYRSYRGMADEDAQAIAAWIMAQPPTIARVPSHELPVPVRVGQALMAGWNRLANLLEPEFPVIFDEQIRRGAYLARNLGHCGECHTPRNRLGIPDLNREFHGAPVVDGEASAITAEEFAEWSDEDFAFFLFLGLKPDGEYVGGEMEAVIEHNTSPLTEDDRLALAAFFIRGQNRLNSKANLD
ncbi:MAG: cytochrome c [Pseudohongiellaceae bacterium]